MLPLVRFVTSTNKSVLLVPLGKQETGKNGKQYLTIECVCLHLLHIWYNTIIAIIVNKKKEIACTVTCILQYHQDPLIWSSSGKLIVNSRGNVLPIGFAFTWDILVVFILRNAVSIACIVLWYQIKNTLNDTIRRMSQRKAAYEHMINTDCHNSVYFIYSVNFFWFLV